MSANVRSVAYEIYPRRYFDASPTWFVWNKLTAADVHNLREEKGFEGQQIYFILNNPIQYVRLVGLVAGVESIATTKYTLITLDDGSGTNIEIKVTGRDVKPGDTTKYPSNTEVDNLVVNADMGLPRVLIDHHPIDVGTVICAQGMISTFRNTRQLVLKRIRRIRDTNDEVVFWSKAAEWKRTVLSRPWIMTAEERANIDKEIQQREMSDRTSAEETRKRYARAMKSKQRHLEKREAKRLLQEEKMNAGALEGSDFLRMPWD